MGRIDGFRSSAGPSGGLPDPTYPKLGMQPYCQLTT